MAELNSESKLTSESTSTVEQMLTSLNIEIDKYSKLNDIDKISSYNTINKNVHECENKIKLYKKMINDINLSLDNDNNNNNSEDSLDKIINNDNNEPSDISKYLSELETLKTIINNDMTKMPVDDMISIYKSTINNINIVNKYLEKKKMEIKYI